MRGGVLALALAVFAFFVVVFEVNGHNECVRVQELREAHNALAAIQWLVDDSAAKREYKLWLAQRHGISEGVQKGAKIHLHNAYALRRLNARLRYQPPTDCGAAALPGYRRPPSEPFTPALADRLTR